MNDHERVKKAIKAVANYEDYYPRYESIFVDEAQSLNSEYWEVLIDLLHEKGPFHLKWIFFDDNQAVGFSRPPKAKRNNIYHLKNVIRNTVNIFNFSKPYYSSETYRGAKVDHGIEGPIVDQIYRFSDFEIQTFSIEVLEFLVNKVDELLGDLKQLHPTDVGILVENQPRARALRGEIRNHCDKIHPYILNDMVRDLSHGNWTNLPLGKCGITIDSVSRCAGLHFKAVILLLSENLINKNLKQKIYIGITRACCKLIVIAPREGQVCGSEDCQSMDVDPEE